MTEKRFTLGVCEEGLGLYDNQTKEQYLELADDHLIRICALLNELHEENRTVLHIIDWCLTHHREVGHIVFDSRDEFFIWLNEKGVLE